LAAAYPDAVPLSLSPIRWAPADALVERQRASGLLRALWAQHDREQVLVFQAFRPEIGHTAAAAGTLAVPGFSLDRTTWIKPGFLWMMHRSNWGTAEGQEVVLGIHVSRSWFEQALGKAVLSSERDGAARTARGSSTSVVVQWDPDWSVNDERQPWRAVQVGLRSAAVAGYLAAILGCVDLSGQVAEAREQRQRDGGPLIPDADILAVTDLGTRRRLGIDTT
jgi:hypothetical protein